MLGSKLGLDAVVNRFKETFSWVELLLRKQLILMKIVPSLLIS